MMKVWKAYNNQWAAERTDILELWPPRFDSWREAFDYAFGTASRVGSERLADALEALA